LKPGSNPRTLDPTAVLVFDCYGCPPAEFILSDGY
jgi:hypothetical protein